MRTTVRLCLLIICLLIPIRSAFALNVQALRPNTGAVQGYRLFTSDTLPKGEWWLGFQFNYDREPLEAATMGGPTPRSGGVVDDFVTFDFVTTLGANDWLDLSLDVPVNLFYNIAPVFIPTRDKGGGNVGDIRLSAKFQVFDAYKTKHKWGFAIIPFVTIPTGDESRFFGDAGYTLGGFLVLDKQWHLNRIFFNIGSRFRQHEETIANLQVGHEFLFGAGFQRPLSEKHLWDIILEVQGSTTYKKFIVEEITSPVEVSAVFRKRWDADYPVILQFGGGVGVTDGYSTAHVRAMLGLSIGLFAKKKEPPKFISLDEKIHFETASARILPRSYPTLDKVVLVLNEHPEIEHVLIEGHTDSRGNDGYNLRLSERRATSVMNYLIQQGIDPRRLSATGLGESQPIASNASAAGREENRRVVLRVLHADEAPIPKSPQESPQYERVRESFGKGKDGYYEKVTERWYP